MKYLKNGMIIVKDINELRTIIEEKKISLELIDIKNSNLTHFSALFEDIKEIYGNISNWDVSNIESMHYTFFKSSLNVDLSKWNVKNVRVLDFMFADSSFNGDISNWDVSYCRYFDGMFYNCPFNGDISKWNFSSGCYFDIIFNNNESFQKKYNFEKEIPDGIDFLEWFEKNKDRIASLNVTKEELIDIDNYLDNFDIKIINHKDK